MAIKKFFMKLIIFILVISIIGIALIFLMNYIVKSSEKSKIFDIDNKINIDDADCILVLGCGVINGKPSNMLEDRILTAIDLYKKGIAPKIIMSGDHENSDYDEVNIMKNYAIEKGVPSSDIFMDHAGLSTYESVYRAKKIFNVNKIVVVTQEYHLYRALYICDKFGIENIGVSADLRSYRNQDYREIREFFARFKDAVMCVFKPEPKYLGEAIYVNGNGDITNDG